MKILKSVLIAALSFILFTGIIIPKSTSSAKREYSGEQLYAGFTSDTGAFAHHLSDGLKNQIFIQKNQKSTLNGRKDYQKKLDTLVYKKNPAYFKELKKAFYHKDYLAAQKLVYEGEKYNENYYKHLLLVNGNKKAESFITNTEDKRGGKISFSTIAKVENIAYAVNAVVGVVDAIAAVTLVIVGAYFTDSINTQIVTKGLVNATQ
ncbi:hypothetical protein ACFQ22_13820 [Lentilactobacillus raoultii]|uniref:Sporulation delaying protein family toxin n=1 Tax=Lentilactobacillus raoultii TaxID=1987503 RepID=A0ABW3PKI8_9LACO|nr:hypothetical protein [Lentilactobacillus raoultii]